MGFKLKKQIEKQKAGRSGAGKPSCSERQGVNEGAGEATALCWSLVPSHLAQDHEWKVSQPANSWLAFVQFG